MKIKRPSMVNPSTDALLKKTRSRYTLVVLSAKRARQLQVGEPCRVDRRNNSKFVTSAMKEIVENKITYRIRREHRT